ncbi:hypothetical protein [Kitasatospora sp. NPDC086791]|uniref:hypothetical protein n=1 Tax=unclassified Kitasatospora TaxID=2633591 RepID=UPI003449D11C
MEIAPELLIEASNAEADFQSARAALADARRKRDLVLYAMWRETHDPRGIASLLPTSVRTTTVTAAVAKLAPPQDFTQPELFALPATPAHELAA